MSKFRFVEWILYIWTNPCHGSFVCCQHRRWPPDAERNRASDVIRMCSAEICRLRPKISSGEPEKGGVKNDFTNGYAMVLFTGCMLNTGMMVGEKGSDIGFWKPPFIKPMA